MAKRRGASRGDGACAARGKVPQWFGCGARLAPGEADPQRRGGGVGDAVTCDGEGRVAVQGGWRGAAVTPLYR